MYNYLCAGRICTIVFGGGRGSSDYYFDMFYVTHVKHKEQILKKYCSSCISKYCIGDRNRVIPLATASKQ